MLDGKSLPLGPPVMCGPSFGSPSYRPSRGFDVTLECTLVHNRGDNWRSLLRIDVVFGSGSGYMLKGCISGILTVSESIVFCDHGMHPGRCRTLGQTKMIPRNRHWRKGTRNINVNSTQLYLCKFPRRICLGKRTAVV